ncbi:MAG: hypothetical protein LAP87_23930 [Acidobacteriia bacterium]|nr:hypothetical protein [Terriglobia bacterium]
MPKKTAKPLTPEQIALRHNPGYEPRTPSASDAARQVAADVAVPEAEQFKAKYAAPGAKAAPKTKARGKELTMVALRAKTPSDSRIDTTVSVVDGDREVGHRG